MNPIKMMTVAELRKRLDQDEVLLIDVREPSEHEAESIEKAHLIPLAGISQEKLPTKALPIVLHCRSGSRSERAGQKLLSQDPSLAIYNLKGGIVAWKEAGFPVKSSKHNGLSLDRQTQIAIGFLCFLGVLLGAFVHSWFYALPGFFGLGLIFAGISGSCGMTQVLAKMPWNK